WLPVDILHRVLLDVWPRQSRGSAMRSLARWRELVAIGVELVEFLDDRAVALGFLELLEVLARGTRRRASLRARVAVCALGAPALLRRSRFRHAGRWSNRRALQRASVRAGDHLLHGLDGPQPIDAKLAVLRCAVLASRELFVRSERARYALGRSAVFVEEDPVDQVAVAAFEEKHAIEPADRREEEHLV